MVLDRLAHECQIAYSQLTNPSARIFSLRSRAALIDEIELASDADVLEFKEKIWHLVR
jgi:hypothetical protein